MQKSTKKITSWRHNRDVKINIVTQITFIFNENFLLSLKMPFFHSSRSHSQDTIERFWFNPTAWHRDVMTSRHDITKLILPISARRYARKMIRFCFYDTLSCGLLNSKIMSFCICMMTSRHGVRHDATSWRHKTHFFKSVCQCSKNGDIQIHFCKYSVAEFQTIIVYAFAYVFLS